MTANTQSGSLLNSWDVGAALRELYDLTESMLLPYVLLGDVARQIKYGRDGYNGNDLQVDKVQFGTYYKNVTAEVLSLIHQWNWEETPWGFRFESNGVPIEFYVFSKKYRFFQMPDMGYYGPDIFKLPNEFEKYWKARGLLK